MAIFKGAGVAIITPFHEDGSVDYERFGELIEYQIANRTDAIIVCGTTGESATLTHEEHLDVIRYCVEKVNHRIPVIAGTGSNCTETAVYLSTEAEKIGADALLLVTPYYNKATQNGLYQHFKTVADAVKLPILLYNVPGRTGTTIQPETAVRLCKEVENIVGIKDATGNISQTAHLMSIADGCVDLYSGEDAIIVPILSLGGKGVISVLSNVAPRQTHEICSRYFEGDTAGSMELQLKAVPLVEALFSEVNPIPVKKAVQLMGLCGGTLRMPMTEMEPAHAEKLAEEMKKQPGLLDGFALCSDYCFNTNPFYSREMFEEFVTPYLKGICDFYRSLGYYSIKHTDGNVMPILDMIVGCGPDAIHSLDPQGGVSLPKVREAVGPDICLVGNVNCGLLQTGTDEECDEDVMRSLREGMAAGRGYVFSTSNCAYTGLPLARYERMNELWRRYGVYEEKTGGPA